MSDKQIAELRDHAIRLVQLLDDPHPGLFTWGGCLSSHWQAIALMWGVSCPALPDDVRQACIEALSVCESRCRRHGWVSEKYTAARKHLEG